MPRMVRREKTAGRMLQVGLAGCRLGLAGYRLDLAG